MVWEPGNNIGAGLVNVPGASCWNELAAADLDVASPRGAVFSLYCGRLEP